MIDALFSLFLLLAIFGDNDMFFFIMGTVDNEISFISYVLLVKDKEILKLRVRLVGRPFSLFINCTVFLCVFFFGF